MKRIVSLATTVLALGLFATLFGCGPKGSQYVGKWEDKGQMSGTDCVIDISQNGESFIIKSDYVNGSGNRCTVEFSGIRKLSAEGNLIGEMMEPLSFDKSKSQMFTMSRNNLIYFTRIQQ